MASGSGGGGKSGGRRKGAQSRLTYRQMQASRGQKSRTVRRMRIRQINNSIPF